MICDICYDEYNPVVGTWSFGQRNFLMKGTFDEGGPIKRGIITEF